MLIVIFAMLISIDILMLSMVSDANLDSYFSTIWSLHVIPLKPLSF